MNRRTKIDDLLPLVQKPARYIAGEVGTIVKDYKSGMLRFCLCFPEVYEVGICHTGGHILYKAVNDSEGLICERAYCPAEDMAKLLRDRDFPLFSLESKTSLRDFDCLGFSLEYELSFTNVLEMLDLSGIPIRSADRDERHPLIIAGGPCAFQPEPVAPFFDAFIIGDGEEILPEFLEIVRTNKDPRTKLLRHLSSLQGVYIPSLYKNIFSEFGFIDFKVEEGAPYPVKSLQVNDIKSSKPQAIVPWVEAVHDRLSVEVMRGCGRKCRYCSAGWVYLPVREKSVNDVFEEATRQLDLTGWEELGLLSLSTTDYSGISQLLARLGPECDKRNFSVSVPSIRPEQIDSTALSVLSKVRKSSMTFAPEAGTERLRNVINKKIDIELLFTVMESVFRADWKTVKLYFMIGLPTETDEDINAITELCIRADNLARRYRAKVNISVSPFIPKPHTPFAWEALISESEINRRLGIIKSILFKRKMKISGRAAKLTQIETVLTRGDRTIADAVERAWQIGKGFAAWNEDRMADIWFTAFAEVGIDITRFTSQCGIDNKAPWEIITKGAPREYLLSERERGYSGRLTPSCRELENCADCGICGYINSNIANNNILQYNNNSIYGRRNRKTTTSTINPVIYRVKYNKNGYLRFLGHLDTIRSIIRAIRRSGLEVAHSEGHHKHPKIAFGPPLPTGYSSGAEYMDIEFAQNPQSKDQLRLVMPKGLDILEFQQIFKGGTSLFDSINSALFTVFIPNTWLDFQYKFDELVSHDEVFFERREKNVNIKKFYLNHSFSQIDNELFLTILLRTDSQGSGRPDEFLIASGIDRESVLSLEFCRQELLIERLGEYFNPFGKRLGTWQEIIDRYA